MSDEIKTELTTEQKQAAVIADILSKTVQPSESGDLASITLLEANDYENDVTYVRFHKHGHCIISESSLSDDTMDRLCAAWIAWRVKQYAPPVEDDGGLAELGDHPF